MVFAMALAEWADKDPGELFKGIIKKRSRPPSMMNEKSNHQVVIKAVEQIPTDLSSVTKSTKAKVSKPKVVKTTNKKTVKKVKAVTKTKSKKRKTT